MRIQTRTLTADSANGQQVESFADSGYIWLGRKFTGGGEQIAAAVERTSQALQFWADYYAARNLTTAHRLVDSDGAIYNVRLVEKDAPRGMAVITAETGLNNG
jgi:head-tail adaptor